MLETILGIVLAVISGVVYYVKKRDGEKEKATEDAVSQVALEKIEVLEQEKLQHEYEQRAKEKVPTGGDDFERSDEPFYRVPPKGRNDLN